MEEKQSFNIDKIYEQFACKQQACINERNNHAYEAKEYMKQIHELKAEVKSLELEVEYLTNIINNCQKCSNKL